MAHVTAIATGATPVTGDEHLVRVIRIADRSVYAVARAVDLVDRCVTVWVDELPMPAQSDGATNAVAGWLGDSARESHLAIRVAPLGK